MSLVYKAYTPSVEVRSNFVAQVAAANVPALPGFPLVVPVDVSSALAHRKIWAQAWTVSAAYVLDVDLVGILHGSEVFALPICRMTNVATPTRFWGGFQQVVTNIGAQNENLYRYVNVTLFALSPWRLNMVADKFALRVHTATTGVFDFFLMVQSQQGV